MVRVFVVSLFLSLLCQQGAMAQDSPVLSNKVDVLERQVQQLMQKNSQLQKRLDEVDAGNEVALDQVVDLEKQFRSRMQISGYADVEYIDNSLPGKEPGFRMHHFSLVFTKNIDSQWRLFSEIEYEDAPSIEFEGEPASCEDCSGTVFLEAMNITYSPSALFGIKAGRFFTPAGIWSEDHYPPFVETQERPLHIRKIFPQLVDGLTTYGRLQLGESFFNYQLYTGNGEGNPGSKDKNSSKAVGAKLGLLLPLLTHFEIGASFYQDDLNSDTEKTASGVHLHLESQTLSFQAEYATADFQPVDTEEFTREGYYAQLVYNKNKFGFGYRYDFFDTYSADNLRQENEIRNSLFFNWRVQTSIVLKLEQHEIEPEFSDESTKTIISLVVHLKSQ